VAYRVELTPAAQRDLRSLDRPMLRRIDAKIQSLAEEPRPHGVEKLAGESDVYRIRVGDYRILYQIDDTVVIVLIVRVRHRRDVYRGL
jgi:mRNA interferase RelE/StbE